MQFIFGFDPSVAYNCEHCHQKCCGIDNQDVTLVGDEAQILKQKFPESLPFIASVQITATLKKQMLTRVETCIFLTDQGKCRIQEVDSSLKPEGCRVYPLTFWKMPETDHVLVYISPCGGKGFDWHNESTNIDRSAIKPLYESIEDHFEEYYADSIDEFTPYDGISEERVIHEEKLLKESLKNLEWLKALKNPENKQQFQKVIEDTKALIAELYRDPVSHPIKVEPYLQSAINWLTFNPTVLAFSEDESIMIRLFASIWNYEVSLRVPSQNSTIDKNVANQLAWNTIAAATETFWYSFGSQVFPEVEMDKYENLDNFVNQMIDAFEAMDKEETE